MSRTLILHAVNIRVGGGLQVADSVIRQALKSSDFDRIFISPELQEFSDGGYGNKVEVIGGRFRALKLFLEIQSNAKKTIVYAIFGPTGVPKMFQGKNTTYVVGFATPWLIPSNRWYTKKKSWVYRLRVFAKGIAYRLEASAFVCEAEYIKREMDNWSAPFFVAKNGNHQIFNSHTPIQSKPLTSNVLKLTGLYVSAGYPHKNHKYLYEFAKRARNELGISIAFKVTLTEDEYASIYPQEDRESIIENIGRMPISKLPQLYAEADFVLVPTLMEASSAVIYEALASEKIIFAFDLIFNREIGRDAIIYIDQFNVDEAAKLFAQIFKNKALFERKMEMGRALKTEYALNSKTRYERIVNLLKNVGAVLDNH